MIVLAVIIPLIAYFLLARWLFDKYYWGTNTRLRTTLRLGVLLLPFLDVIIGFIIFGLLCLFSGGAHIYKTVDDVEEQQAYWFQNALNIMDKEIYSGRSIEIDNMSMSLLKRAGMLNTKVEQNKPQPIKHVGYINYCKPEYDTLPVSDKNYRLSCAYTDTIIQQYDIQNVIKPPPKSPYYYEYGDDFILPLGFVKVLHKQNKVINTQTNEVLAVTNQYGTGAGWYLRLFAQLIIGAGGGGAECCWVSSITFQESVIPNPYKQQ